MNLQENSVAKLTFVDGNNLVETLKIVRWIQMGLHCSLVSCLTLELAGTYHTQPEGYSRTPLDVHQS